MGSQDPLGTVLRFVMRDRGWSQTVFARETGVDPSWVSRALSGQRGTAFRFVVDLLSRAGYNLVLVSNAPTMDRRRLLVDLGAVFGAARLSVAIPMSDSPADLRSPEGVHAAVQRYVRTERDVGAGVVYAPAARTARELLRRIGTEKTAPDYARAVGWYMHETAWLAYDAGDRHATCFYATHALEQAQEVGDLRLQARAYNVLSLVATASGNGSSGAETARRGINAARDDGAPERTLLWVRLARAEAVQGRGHEALAMRALGKAEDAITGDRDVYEVVANRGIVLAQLGRFAQARAPLAEAADLIAGMGEPRNRCIYLARSANAAVQHGAFDEGADLIRRVLAAAPDIVSTRVDSQLAKWIRLTARPSTMTAADVQDARDRIRDYLGPTNLA